MPRLHEIQVVKRNGKLQQLSIDAIMRRIYDLVDEEPRLQEPNVSEITLKTALSIRNGIHTSEIDEKSIVVCKDLQKEYNEEEYATLAIRIALSNFKKEKSYAVIKRCGEKEMLNIDEIYSRLNDLSNGLNVDLHLATHRSVINLYNNIQTSEIDELVAKACYGLVDTHLDYDKLAARITLNNLYKNTPSKFSDMISSLHDIGIISDKLLLLVNTHKDLIDEIPDHTRDDLFEYFGVMKLLQSYLLLKDGKPYERPQYMLLRVALEIHRDDFNAVRESYNMMSRHLFTHATPTIFNAGLRKNQLSSCMLLTNAEDSVEGIYETLRDCSVLGAAAAGIGVSMSGIRAKGSIINSTGRPSRGVPAFRDMHNLNVTVIDQGGKRFMSEAVYMEPWHADFMEVMQSRSNEHEGGEGAKNLFYAVWSNNLLYERAKASEDWSFFCPTDAPLLQSTYGEEFKKAYLDYESRGLARSSIKAQAVYEMLAKLQMETGQPYHLNKDACNAKSNMRNVAHINCSNLCAEILIPSGIINGKKEIGVCTLASIALPKFTTPCTWKDEQIYQTGKFNYEELDKVVRVVVRNLNKIVDCQLYPLEACKRSSSRHRPVGLGVQGLADVFHMMGLPYESKEAQELNWRISEQIYYSAIMESMELAKEEGPYETFTGSPASEGKLQPHLWQEYGSEKLPYTFDWDSIGKKVAETGLRNALLVAYMPTASTSDILGNSTCFEPYNSNIFSKQVLGGKYIIRSKNLIKLLRQFGKWNKATIDQINASDGSIQSLNVSTAIKNVYRTAWEINPKKLMDMAADRGQFTCHTQSLNLFVPDATIRQLTSLMMRGMKLGLPTISYYVRSKAAVEAVKQTVERSVDKPTDKPKTRPMNCTGDVCEMCSA